VAREQPATLDANTQRVGKPVVARQNPTHWPRRAERSVSGNAEQLAAAGFGPGAVARLVRKTWLRRVHRGVYLVGPLRSARTPETAALLACGDRAVLSHRIAARLWRLPCPAPGAVEVTVQGSARAHAGVRVHRTGRLDPRDIRVLDGCRVTAPARTLLDLAADAPLGELARAPPSGTPSPPRDERAPGSARGGLPS
jgi:hypothetical protein